MLAGEMSAKVVAKCFWHREVEYELFSHGLWEKWTFTSERNGPLTGTNDVMEFIDKQRCGELYSQNCYTHCKEKGL